MLVDLRRDPNTAIDVLNRIELVRSQPAGRGRWNCGAGWRDGTADIAFDRRLRLIALIEEAAVIGRILRHLGVPTEIPVPCPARAPPLRAGASDQAGWDDDTAVFTRGS